MLIVITILLFIIACAVAPNLMGSLIGLGLVTVFLAVLGVLAYSLYLNPGWLAVPVAILVVIGLWMAGDWAGKKLNWVRLFYAYFMSIYWAVMGSMALSSIPFMIINNYGKLEGGFKAIPVVVFIVAFIPMVYRFSKWQIAVINEHYDKQTA